MYVCMYIRRVGQNHIYIYGADTFFYAGIDQMYGHKRRIYTVLANPIHTQFWPKLTFIQRTHTAFC